MEERYEGQPLLIIGVHSAKFDTENQAEGIRGAIARYGIRHPVIHDREQALWRFFGVNAWPSFVLISSSGQAAGRTSGEGRRLALDAAIERLMELGRNNGTLNKQARPIPLRSEPDSLLRFPGKLALDRVAGRVFVADSGHNRVLCMDVVDTENNSSGNPESNGKSRSATSIDMAGTRLSAIIGSGQPGFRDGSFDSAEFLEPQGLFCAGSRLYIADTGNHAIRQADLASRTVTTLAGNGEQAGWRSDGGFGPATALNSPWDVLESAGCLYIAMAGSHQLWRLDLSTDQIAPFAGNGREDLKDGPAGAAELAQPSGLCQGRACLYFADSEASAIRSASLPDGQIRTLVGAGLFVWGHRDGALKDARMQHPLGIDFNNDMLYVADTYNHAIRVIDLATRQVSTVLASSGSTACRLEDEGCQQPGLFEPADVKHWNGQLWIADTGNHLIRRLDLASGQLQTLEIIADQQQ